MKTPNFWKNKNCISFLLYPFSILYYIGRFLHILFSKEYKVNNLKIICIGNIVVGGSGKTPIAIKIGKMFKKNKVNFAFLSKGYKGELKNFTKVNHKKHTFKEVGDEPLLLSEIADTYICNNRMEAIKKLSKQNKYNYVIMDDGFQNPTIYKDINILVIDGNYGIGNNQLLPSGPLRETLNSALKRTSFIVLMNKDIFSLENKIKKIKNIPIFNAKTIEKRKKLINKKYIAFSGIGRNEKFFNSLNNLKYNVIKKFSFEDHHIYTENEMKKLLDISKNKKAILITTKKDWVKIDKKYKNIINYLDIDVNFSNEEKFFNFLIKRDEKRK